MNTLLVPVDFSNVSPYVIAEGTKLARLTKYQLTLLHVLQPAPMITTDYGAAVEKTLQLAAKAEKNAIRQLARLKKKLKAGGLMVETALLSGSPVSHILDQAEKQAASYIVIGSHGHTAFYDLLVGSTTSGVLKRAACPVVVVSMHKRAKTRSAKKS